MSENNFCSKSPNTRSYRILQAAVYITDRHFFCYSAILTSFTTRNYLFGLLCPQEEVRGSLEKILQINGRHEHCDEEACVGLYVDTIQVHCTFQKNYAHLYFLNIKIIFFSLSALRPCPRKHKKSAQNCQITSRRFVSKSC